LGETARSLLALRLNAKRHHVAQEAEHWVVFRAPMPSQHNGRTFMSSAFQLFISDDFRRAALVLRLVVHEHAKSPVRHGDRREGSSGDSWRPRDRPRGGTPARHGTCCRGGRRHRQGRGESERLHNQGCRPVASFVAADVRNEDDVRAMIDHVVGAFVASTSSSTTPATTKTRSTRKSPSRIGRGRLT
jgi:hypothetical protein